MTTAAKTIKRESLTKFKKKKLRQYEVQKAACDMFLYSDSIAQESGGLLLEVML